jgi:hypothetical protein
VGDPPGAGELERQRGQQPGDGGDDPGAGVAGQGGQVQRHQDRDGQQQSGRVLSGRVGQAVKSMIAAPGQVMSRPEVAGEMLASGSGCRSSRPNSSSARISATEVRLAGCPRLSAAGRSRRWTAPAGAAR